MVKYWLYIGQWKFNNCLNDFFVFQPRADAQTEKLEKLAIIISDFYATHGLHSKQRRMGDLPVLHMTLLNAKSRWPVFNANGILSDFADFTFIEGAACGELSLCKMGSEDPETHFYHTEAAIKWTE